MYSSSISWGEKKKKKELATKESIEKNDDIDCHDDVNDNVFIEDEILDDMLETEGIEQELVEHNSIVLDEMCEEFEESDVPKNGEDCGEYLGHFVPITEKEKSTGRSVGDGVLKHVEQKYEAKLARDLKGITDGTSKMTGCKTGAMAIIERRVGHAIQRSGCMHHHLEKPYEHLHNHYDGVTTGPATFSGPLGKSIEKDVWKEEVVNFTPILNPELLKMIQEMPDKVKKNLSRDTRYGIAIAEVILTGTITEWVHKKSGNIHQARWLNRQIRLLRVYISTPNPSYIMI